MSPAPTGTPAPQARCPVCAQPLYGAETRWQVPPLSAGSFRPVNASGGGGGPARGSPPPEIWRSLVGCSWKHVEDEACVILGDCVLCPLFQPVSERCPQALLPCMSPACSWAGLCPLDKWKFLDLWKGSGAVRARRQCVEAPLAASRPRGFHGKR